MSSPVFSPDGKFMWTGAEWIPTPPSSPSVSTSSVNMEDSMMSGDVNVKQQSNDISSAINLKDSAMSGDIVINQNNAQEIADAVATAFNRIGFSRSLQKNNDLPITQEVEQIAKLAENLQNVGAQLDTDTIWNLYRIAASNNTEKAKQYSNQLIEMHTRNNEFYELCWILEDSAQVYAKSEDIQMELQLVNQALSISRTYNFKDLELKCLISLANTSNEGGLSLNAQQELLERAFNLMNELGDTTPQARAYTAYGNLLRKQGKYHESITAFENLIQVGTSAAEIAAGMLGVATCYDGKGDKPNAIIAYQRAIDYCIINGELTYADWGKNQLASL